MIAYEETKTSPYGNVVLITNASSAIGQSTALMLKDYGFHVYGASSESEFVPAVSGYECGFFKSLKMDVDDRDSVRKAVKAIMKYEPSIDILINCADMAAYTLAEQYSRENTRSTSNTNLYSYINTLKQVLPIMRLNHKGLIINIESVDEIFAMPYHSFYGANKFSIEAITKSLRAEVAPFEIKTILIVPGKMKLEPPQKIQSVQGSSTKYSYSDRSGKPLKTDKSAQVNVTSADKVAKVILRVIKAPNPPERVVVGAKYKVLVFLNRILPANIIGYLKKRLY